MQQKPKIRPGPKSSKTGNSQVLIFNDITLINFKRLVKYESLNWKHERYGNVWSFNFFTAAIAAAAASASTGPKMVKITYGGSLSGEVFDDNLEEDDDSGNMADESEMTEDVETRVIQFTTSALGGQQFTATTVNPHPNTVKVIKAHNPVMASKGKR